MKHKKRTGLPHGLRWHSESQFIWFTWRDAEGRQHQKSTETTDPAKALIFKIQFLQEQETPTTNHVGSTDLTNEPLDQVAKLYFDWKLANNSSDTVSRERRMFKTVLRFFGPKTTVKSVRLAQISALGADEALGPAGIERGKSGQPEIAGYTREYLDASSPRSQQIQAYLEQQGVKGAGADRGTSDTGR